MNVEAQGEGETPKEEKTHNGNNAIPSLNQLPGFPGQYEDPVICKLEPYNICYRFDKKGNLLPLGARRPVRLIRIYK